MILLLLPSGVVTTLISLSSLYAQILAYDERQEMLHGSSVGAFETSPNTASRQCRGPYNNRLCGDRGDRNDRRKDRRNYR
jgi:hypothetical protein